MNLPYFSYIFQWHLTHILSIRLIYLHGIEFPLRFIRSIRFNICIAMNAAYAIRISSIALNHATFTLVIMITSHNYILSFQLLLSCHLIYITIER